MRIVHTSDWHAGRRWHGLDRSDELRATLMSMCEWVEHNDVHLALVSGDLFDGAAPSATALRLVLDVLTRLGRTCPVVAIAGNHDNNRRIDALAELASLANVHLRGRPRSKQAGGVLDLRTEGGRAIVACLPFAPVRTLVSALDRQDDDTVAYQRYADGVRALVTHLTTAFEDDAVNLLIAHTHLDGAQISNSERLVHVGDQWAAPAQTLPADAHYVALGHIHRPQSVDHSGSPAVYAGSPLQLDFGEEGEDKSFVVVDATPGAPATIRRQPYAGGRELSSWQGSLEALHAQAEALVATNHHLRLTLDLDGTLTDIARTVRDLVPNAVIVRVNLPEAGDAPASERPDAPRALFEMFYRHRHGVDAPTRLADAFDEVYAAAVEGAP